MAIRLGALGLAINYDEGAAPFKVAATNTRVSSLVLAARYGVALAPEPPGAVASAEAGNLTVTVPNPAEIAKVGSLILAAPKYNLAPKQGNVTVTILGSFAQAEGEELEGSNVTIRLVGAVALTFGGSVEQGELGTIIENLDAVEIRSDYEICQRTGFRQLPEFHPLSDFIRDGYGEYVRRKSVDSRHPQDYGRSRGNDRQEGPQNPESDDNFLTTTVEADDL